MRSVYPSETERSAWYKGIGDRFESQLLDFETAMENEIDSISNSIDNKVVC